VPPPCLNEHERRDVIEIAGPDCNYQILPNGIPQWTNVTVESNLTDCLKC
jgi:hypothetical protein